MFEGILTVVSGRSAPFRCLGHGLTAGVDSWEVTACSLQCYCLLTCHHLELHPGHPLTAALLSLSLRSVSSGFQLTFVLEILGTSNYTLKKKKRIHELLVSLFPGVIEAVLVFILQRWAATESEVTVQRRKEWTHRCVGLLLTLVHRNANQAALRNGVPPENCSAHLTQESLQLGK